MPYLTNLLEDLGIPATRGLHRLSNQLVQLFIGQWWLSQLVTDEKRVEQQNQALVFADERTKKGKEQIQSFLTWTGFWKRPQYDAEDSPETKVTMDIEQVLEVSQRHRC